MTVDPAGSAAPPPRVLTPVVVGLLTLLVPSLLVVGLGVWLALAARDLAAAEFGGVAPGGLDLGMDGHALVLLLLFWLLVVLTRSLWGGGGGRVVAVVVVLLTAAGPGSLAASPAFSWVVDTSHAYDSSGVVLWWSWAVAVGWLALVLSTAIWTLRRYPVATSGTYLERGRFLLALLVFAGCQAVASYVSDFWLDPGHVELSPAMQLGWTALVAGLVTAAATTSSLGSRVAMLLLAPALVAEMYLAYNRTGGWPGVPGWEAARSPLYSTVGVAILVCAAPLVGWLIGVAEGALERALSRRLPRHLPSGAPSV
jgi:hypothetical protein